MKKILSAAGASLLTFFLLATSVSAQAPGALNIAPIKNFGDSLIAIMNTVLVPVIFALAFITFLWGVFQYFIVGATQPEKRQEGVKFVMWSIIGMVVMISIWGIVNLVGNTLPTGSNNRPALPTFDSAQGKPTP